MAHPGQMEFMQSLKEKFPNNFQNSNVLEIGSLDINGSIRSIFNNCLYIGIDVGPGKNVDVVCEGQKYNGPDRMFDTVVSCECFEHNPYWFETFMNMYRMCKFGGLIIFTCATTGRWEHGTTRASPEFSPLTVAKGWDYYRNLTEQDFRSGLNLNHLFKYHEFQTPEGHFDLNFYGLKRDTDI